MSELDTGQVVQPMRLSEALENPRMKQILAQIQLEGIRTRTRKPAAEVNYARSRSGRR